MTQNSDHIAEQEIETPRHGRAAGELFFVLLLLMGAAVLLHQAWSIAGFKSFSSAGVFPMLATGGMLLSGIFIVIQTIKMPRSDEGPAWRNFFQDIVGIKVLFIGVLITAYLFLLQPLGFVFSSILFLSIAICGLHRRNYVAMIALSIAIVAVVYLLFRYVFVVVLPQGVLF